MSNRLSCINCGRKCNSKHNSSKSGLRSVSDKKYRWSHNLLNVHRIKLQPETIFWNQCRTSLYRENKRCWASGIQSVPNTDDRKDDTEEKQQQRQTLLSDKVLVLDNIYGNGDDYIYCVWCMKSGVEMTSLSLSDRMTLLCQHNLYTSPNVRRCTNSCYDAPRKCPHKRTRLSIKESTDLIDDLTTELSRIKSTPFITENNIALSEEDYLTWTRWTLGQLKDMTSLVASHMNSSKHRTSFEAICQFWIKLKTTLSFRQLGTLFKICTSEESIRCRVEDTFYVITNYMNDMLVSSNLSLNHLTRPEALNHDTAYTKAFFDDQLSIIWDGTYVYCNKST